MKEITMLHKRLGCLALLFLFSSHFFVFALDDPATGTFSELDEKYRIIRMGPIVWVQSRDYVHYQTIDHQRQEQAELVNTVIAKYKSFPVKYIYAVLDNYIAGKDDFFLFADIKSYTINNGKYSDSAIRTSSISSKEKKKMTEKYEKLWQLSLTPDGPVWDESNTNWDKMVKLDERLLEEE